MILCITTDPDPRRSGRKTLSLDLSGFHEFPTATVKKTQDRRKQCVGRSHSHESNPEKVGFFFSEEKFEDFVCLSPIAVQFYIDLPDGELKATADFS